MKAERHDEKLDALIRAAMGRHGLTFDFRQWRQRYLHRIAEFELQHRTESTWPARLVAGHTSLYHRPTVKLAAVAAIIVAVLILVSPFNESLDGTTAAYAKVTEAVRKVPWMHIRYTGYSLDEMGNRRSTEGAYDTEIWYSFNAQVAIQRYSDGGITYRDYVKQEVHTYNPVSKRIVISALATDRLPLQADSPWSWVERNIRAMTPVGRDVTRTTGQYNGQDVEIFEIVGATKPGMAAVHGKVFVDRATFLPMAEERISINTNIGKPQLVETGTFDYPEHGPADLYELGLSRDIPVINNLPLPEWWEIRSAYESHRRKIPAERYIAVVTREMTIPGNPVDTVDICYADATHFREERHFLYHRGYIGDQWEHQAAELGNTLDSILKWSRANKAYGPITISIYDARHYYGSRRGEGGSWSTTEQTLEGREFTKDLFWGMSPVAELGWPDISGTADIVQDDYARENHLIRVEAPEGTFILNPDRDYICQKRINAYGQMEDVTEFGPTDDGRWYPKEVKSDALRRTVYMDTDPEFPEEIFDPNRLPKAGQ
jgi:hypothetical protein